MNLNCYLDEGAYLPERAHPTDAGLDLRSPANVLVRAGGSAIIRTGVHIQLAAYTAGHIWSKSGLNTNHDITTTGLIDEGYTGEIVVKLYNHGKDDYLVTRGDKIAQLVISPVLYPIPVQVYEPLPETERGDAGFGSTGR